MSGRPFHRAHPRGVPCEAPLLEPEVLEAPRRLSDHDWLTEACPDQRRRRGDTDMEHDHD